jgi:predicted nucleotidyltransferase component of viral defense system
MIRQAEIQKIARQEGVRDTQIEKDYVLSWILTGFANSKLLSENIVFKGGTCLKKIYFKDYRHSEDLDFTLLNHSISNDAMKEAVVFALEYVKEKANITLSICDFNEHETGSLNFYISYIGALGGSGANKRVKVDISKDELLKFGIVGREMFETYSDHESCRLKCYSLQEIMMEKMRSLLSRQQPRDYYDLWYLSNQEGLEMSDYRLEFEEKTRYKGFNPENLEKRVDQLSPIFKTRWIGSMNHQIKELPPFEQVSRELARHFRKLFKK